MLTEYLSINSMKLMYGCFVSKLRASIVLLRNLHIDKIVVASHVSLWKLTDNSLHGSLWHCKELHGMDKRHATTVTTITDWIFFKFFFPLSFFIHFFFGNLLENWFILFYFYLFE